MYKTSGQRHLVVRPEAAAVPIPLRARTLLLDQLFRISVMFLALTAVAVMLALVL